jgi:alpha-2-macroglobulin
MATYQKRLFRKRLASMFASVVVIATICGLLVSCGPRPTPAGKVTPVVTNTPGEQPIGTPVSGQTGGGSQVVAANYQLGIRLSEGQPVPQAVEALPIATGVPLAEDALAQILSRLPQITPEPADQTEFKPAQGPIPPPLTGGTRVEPFPPTEPAPPAPTAGPAGALEVLRYAPEGDIPLAPFVSITFNQPMVPLGTLSDLAAKGVPVQVEPALTGTWRWVGTKTLTFEYDSALIDRLPKATEYRVTVPAGTQSVTGGKLEKAVSWTFRTPPPRVVTTYPYDTPQPLKPIFFIAFDQRIDPAAVLKTVAVTAGGQPVGVELADIAAIQASQEVSQLVKYTGEGRWLAFRATAPLPADTRISVNIGPNTPSAEGPLVTTDTQSYGFSTYAPLRIEDHGCSWGDNQCRPLVPFFIRFNNPLDTQAFKDTQLKVTPEIPGMVINAYGNSIEIRGETKGQTTYQVVVSGGLTDLFGQTLGSDATLTFRVGNAESLLVGPNQALMTVDPVAAKPVFSVYAINYTNLAVKIYAVQPSDWPGFKQYLRAWQQTDNPPTMPGRLVFDQTIRVEAAADVLTQVDIDLSKYMDGAFGQYIVKVEPPKGWFESDNDKWRRFSQTVQTWVQITQIGLDAFSDPSDLVVWTTALKDGAPLAGVSILAPTGPLATTGQDGTAKFAIPSGATYLVAKQGADQALLPRSAYAWGDDAWNPMPMSDAVQWYVFDDRQMYRPGEEVHVKGWLRRIGNGKDGDVGLVGSGLSGITYRLTDPQGNEIGNGQAAVNALGGFDLTFTLPQSVNLGQAQLALNAPLGGVAGNDFYHAFQIQEFRRPEFEVTARNESAGPYYAGDHATLAVGAQYYAGGPLPNADVVWQVTYSPGTYAPPNWPDFTFGTWHPWWEGPIYSKGVASAPDFMPFGSGGSSTGNAETFTGKTDAGGTHYLRLDFDQVSLGANPQPVSVLASASVMDVNRQAWSSSTSLLVHPASLYVGLRSDRYFVERGTPLKVDFIVTDLEGKPVADRPVEIQAARLEWKYQDGNWQNVPTDIQKCQQGSAATPVTCTFETAVGGEYQITATVTDESGRQNQSQLTRWVSGGKQVTSRTVQQEKVTLIPDKQTYQPGDVAKILVQSPFSPAEGELTVSRNGILYTQRFHIDDGTTTLDVPIEDKHTPNLNLQVDVVGAAPRTNDQGDAVAGVPARPAYATGQLNLNIPPLQRTLSLEVTPGQRELEPGGETTLSLVLKDAAGKPVPDAELAAVVVDEAILALTNYQLADPISTFYSDRPAYVDSIYSRANIVLLDPQTLAQAAQQANSVALEKSAGAGAVPAAVPMAAATATVADGAYGARDAILNQAGSTPIRVRSDFNPLATFAPSVRTDDNGHAQVAVKVPDNLTRYRVMVVAVEGGRRFGMAESNVVARLPLMVRPSAPRFLNFGDSFELPVVLQNQTDTAMEVDVALRATNLELSSPTGAGLKVTVPARDRVEVRFAARTQKAGTARVQIAASSGAYADAATIELPVYTPATTEAFATYGVIDAGAVIQPVEAPSAVFSQYGGLELNTSSTALQALTDAVLYLYAYPYECTEQLSSRILSIAALRDVLTAFKAEGLPAPADMEAAVQRDIDRLQGLQNFDGGFPYWRRGFDSIPFNTIHVAHALYRAQAKGFTVPADMQSRTLEYLRQIESYYPAWYDARTRDTLSAYALYVRHLMGDRDPDKALKLLDRAGLENLMLEPIGWLWPVLEDAPNASAQLDAIRRYVGNHVVETAGAANFTTAYSDQSYLLLSSDRRTDAILLEALIVDNPQSDLIPKVVNGLLAHRSKGHWGNTQEDVFVLLALDHYFNTFEAQTPDFVARLWLGNTYAGDLTFQGRSTERQEIKIPMAYLTDPALGGGATQNLVLSKEGTGRLYYRLGLRYAPTDLNLKPLDMGFVVQRRYEAVDRPEDVSQDADGVWHIKAGARVRVRITMVADNRRYHVALADPLPAGLEIVNPALAVSGSTPQDPTNTSYRYGWWWWSTWYEHQNMRDERAEAFTSLLWEGVYDYTYIARATTPGTFIVPPAKAEEMYSPEVFGRSGSDWVKVESK